MRRVLLINPNTARATTRMMVRIARAVAPPGVAVLGVTAQRGPRMILDVAALVAAAREVTALGAARSPGAAGVIVAAYGDPGLAALRRALPMPVTGIAEAAMLEAARSGRRFGIATVTPELVGPISEHARELGLAGSFTGIRLTESDPVRLLADPKRLDAEMLLAIRRCVERDGAQVVAIGGGPLGLVAARLARRVAVPLVAPVPAAMRALLAMMTSTTRDAVPRGGGAWLA